MNTLKIIGFVLLAVGLAIILFSLVSSFSIYTGSSEPAQIFVAPQGAGAKEFSPSSLQDLQEQLPQLLGQQLQGLIPQNAVPQMLNFFVWSMLSGLLLLGGSLVAGIGVKLLK
jgi:hypothetical protein